MPLISGCWTDSIRYSRLARQTNTRSCHFGLPRKRPLGTWCWGCGASQTYNVLDCSSFFPSFVEFPPRMLADPMGSPCFGDLAHLQVRRTLINQLRALEERRITSRWTHIHGNEPRGRGLSQSFSLLGNSRFLSGTLEETKIGPHCLRVNELLQGGTTRVGAGQLFSTKRPEENPGGTQVLLQHGKEMFCSMCRMTTRVGSAHYGKVYSIAK